MLYFAHGHMPCVHVSLHLAFRTGLTQFLSRTLSLGWPTYSSWVNAPECAHCLYTYNFVLHRTVSPNRMYKSLFLTQSHREGSLSLSASLFLSLCASLSDTTTLHLSVSLSLTVSLYLSDISALHLSIPFCLIEFSVSHPSEVEHSSPPWMLSQCETGK